MTGQIDYSKTLLQKRRMELAGLIRAQSSRLALDADERELIDRMQGMNMRDEAVTLLDKLSHNLADVDAALEAIEDGSYGTCAECGERISAKRLQALPWAAHCIRCQELIERLNQIRPNAIEFAEAA